MSEETTQDWTWKCLGCGSVCNSEGDEPPAPCDYCESMEVVAYEDAPEDAPADVVHPEDAQ